MVFIWLQRLILLALLVVGALFALDNRHAVLINIGGDTYSVSAYLLFFILLSAGFIGGALLSRLSMLAEAPPHKKP